MLWTSKSCEGNNQECFGTSHCITKKTYSGNTASVQTVDAGKNIDEAVVEILKVATTAPTRNLPDERTANREALQVLCDVADCEKSDLVRRMPEMKRKLEESVNDVARLWNCIDKQELQVREQTDQLRDLGRSRS